MTFPSIWKQAEVIPIEKVANPSEAKDFRPISLLYHCSKIAEYFLMKEYKKEILPRVNKNQFAYQKRLGTVDALVYNLDKWTQMLDCKNTVAVNVVFKDFSKAFNCMQPEVLLKRLQDLNVTNNMIRLCNSFLSERKQRVRISDKTSDYLPVDVGVPQGTISGPFFWIAFIDSYDAPNVNTTKYADDISCSWPTEKSTVCADKTVVHLPAQPVSDCINYGIQWSNANYIKLNISKTKVLPLSVRKECIYSDSCDVEVVDRFHFLGVTVDSHLTFKPHIENIVNKAKKRSYLLIKLKRLGVSTEKLKLFYISNIRSVLTYAAPSFFGYLTAKQVESMERVQRFTTKVILPFVESYSDRLSLLKLPILSDFMDRLSCAYFKKICDCDTIMQETLPMKRSETGLRSSKRLKNSFIVEKTRTNLRKNSFLVKYSYLN